MRMTQSLNVNVAVSLSQWVWLWVWVTLTVSVTVRLTLTVTVSVSDSALTDSVTDRISEWVWQQNSNQSYRTILKVKGSSAIHNRWGVAIPILMQPEVSNQCNLIYLLNMEPSFSTLAPAMSWPIKYIRTCWVWTAFTVRIASLPPLCTHARTKPRVWVRLRASVWSQVSIIFRRTPLLFPCPSSYFWLNSSFNT